MLIRHALYGYEFFGIEYIFDINVCKKNNTFAEYYKDNKEFYWMLQNVYYVSNVKYLLIKARYSHDV